MYCPGCGANNEDNVRFCHRCGRQLHDGSADKPNSGPAWSEFAQAIPEPPVQLPEPPPIEPLPLPTPPQVVVGVPKRDFPIAMLAGIVLALGAVAGIAYGIFYAVDNLDKDSLPIVADNSTPSPSGPDGSAILLSLTSTCKDTNNQDCNLNWDLTAVTSDANSLRIDFEVRATGQANCAVAIQPDQALASSLEAAGRPGPFVEGARGRYYPLRGGEGLTQTGGALNCGQAQTGVWLFRPVTGESFVKLRYPGLPPARIELDPLSVRALPVDDPYSVIPVQQPSCQAVDTQPCTGVWEIGPYGLAVDGAPIVFFAVRFDGSANCQVNWIPDTAGHAALIANGNRGIGLELTGNTGFLPLTGGGGLSSFSGPLNCGTVLTGFWRFSPGAVTPTVNLFYPDFPVAQIPLTP